jgi:hypothetical protein
VFLKAFFEFELSEEKGIEISQRPEPFNAWRRSKSDRQKTTGKFRES